MVDTWLTVTHLVPNRFTALLNPDSWYEDATDMPSWAPGCVSMVAISLQCSN